MASSDFCYTPPGAAHGDSDRYLPAVLYGCVPVFVKDGEVLPFEEELPWHRVALTLRLRDTCHLDAILRNVSHSQLVGMRRAMEGVWRALLWSTSFPLRRGQRNGYLGEDGKGDALDTFVRVLERRLLADERR